MFVQVKRSLLISAAITLGLILPAHALDFSKFLNSKESAAEAPSPPVRSEAVDPKSKDVPDWLKDSQKLKDMLGADANFRVENPKVIRRVDAPFPGLEGYVVEATSYSDATPDGKKELFVFYTDKSQR